MCALEERAVVASNQKGKPGYREDQLGTGLSAKSAAVTSILNDVENDKIRAGRDDVVENEELEAWLNSKGRRMPPWRTK